jgi:hypothetical protein
VSALRQALKLVGYGDHDVLKYCLSCFEKSILSAGVQGDCSMSHAITPLFPDNIWFSKALPYPISHQASPFSESQGEVYVALYEYVAQTAKDLSFKKGERILVLLKQDEDCWFAKSLKSQKVGCIPSNYAIEAKNWYWGDITRAEAEKQLVRNRRGTFLVRISSSQDCLSLSVRDVVDVKHYLIRRSDNRAFYISPEITFPTLNELITHHYSGGLVQRLLEPCPRGAPTTAGLSHGDKWQIDRSTLQFTKKLNHGSVSEVWEGMWNGITLVAIRTVIGGQYKYTVSNCTIILREGLRAGVVTYTLIFHF